MGDWIYLRLQLYRQTSVKLRDNTKLSAKYFGPYQVIQKIGNVAYRLKLLKGTKVHFVFHVSLLKRKVGQKAAPMLQLPNTDEKEHLMVEPLAVLDQKIVKKKNVVAIQWLIRWWETSIAEATQEDVEAIEREFLGFQS